MRSAAWLICPAVAVMATRDLSLSMLTPIEAPEADLAQPWALWQSASALPEMRMCSDRVRSPGGIHWARIQPARFALAPAPTCSPQCYGPRTVLPPTAS